MATTTLITHLASTTGPLNGPLNLAGFGPSEWATIYAAIIGGVFIIGAAIIALWNRSGNTASQSGGQGNRAAGNDYTEETHATGEHAVATSGEGNTTTSVHSSPNASLTTVSIERVDQLIIPQSSRPSVGRLAANPPESSASVEVVELSANSRFIIAQVERIFPGSGNAIRENYGMVAASPSGAMGVSASIYLRIFTIVSRLCRESGNFSGDEMAESLRQLEEESLAIEQILRTATGHDRLDGCVNRGEGCILALLGRSRL